MEFAAPYQLLVVLALDRRGNDVGHRAQKIHIVAAKAAVGRAVDAQHAKRPRPAGNLYCNSAANLMRFDQWRWAKGSVLRVVVDRHALLGQEGVSGLVFAGYR